MTDTIFSSRPIAPNTWLIQGDGCNSYLVVGDECGVVIDTGFQVENIQAYAQTLTDKPVKYVINSHHAFDHTSANCFLADKGAILIGSKVCRDELMRHGQHNFKRWSDRRSDVRKLLQEKGVTVALPQITFDHELCMDVGGERIELFFCGHAHTPGDILIYLPKDQILFAGDLLWFGYFPNIREAVVPSQIAVANRILEFPVKYYIPGHGHISSDRNEVIRMRDFLSSIYESVKGMVEEGKSFEEIKRLECPFAEKNSDWAGKQFLTRAIDVLYQSMTGR